MNITTNSIEFPPWLHGTFYFLIGVMAVAGNIANILVLPKLTNYPDSAKRFMTILALNDLGSGVVLFLVSPCTWSNRWLYGDITCKILGFLFFFFGGGGSTILLLMNLDRYFAISKPFIHQRYMSDRVVIMLCVSVLGLWFIFIQLCMTIHSFLDNVVYDRVYRLCITQLQNLQGVYPFLLSFCLYFQIFVLLIIYIRLWHTSRQHFRRIQAAIPTSSALTQDMQSTSNSDNHQSATTVQDRRSEFKAVRTALLVTGFFILSYAPYSTAVILNFLRVAIPPWLDAFIIVIAVCNTWWNTIVYSIYNRSFRERILKTFRCKYHWWELG